MGLLKGMENEKRHSIQGHMCRKITSPFFGTLGVIDGKPRWRGDYISWERYFTVILTDGTKNTYLAYSKRKYAGV